MGHEVQIWFTCVDRQFPSREHVRILDDGERAQASRFRFERDRARFLARRAFRRGVLAYYLDIEPARVRIRTSAKGRPEVDSVEGVRFSTSHSDGLAVVAVTKGRHIGVDLERIRPITDALELAERLFGATESKYLRSMEAADRSEAFLAVWTRKESVVKAAGEGLSMPLDGFNVLASDAAITRPMTHQPDSSFVLSGLDGISGYVGAVAVAAPAHVSLRIMAPAAQW